MQEDRQPQDAPPALPRLSTPRLILRPFEPGDSETVERLANDREIAANTRGIEYPYPKGAASTWIDTHEGLWLTGKGVVFAICNRGQAEGVANCPEGALLGAMLLNLDSADHRGELGYWLGRAWWNLGIASEAARAVLQFGFDQLGLNRIDAHHLARNPASGRVLLKAGMLREGLLRQHARKWGEFHDVVLYGVLARDWKAGRPPAGASTET